MICRKWWPATLFGVSASAVLMVVIFLVCTGWYHDTHTAFSSRDGISTRASPSPSAKPVVTDAAERDHDITAAAERDVYLERLQSSGEAMDGAWLASAHEIVKQWHQAKNSSGHRITVQTLHCFQTGCAVTTVFPSHSDFDEVTEMMARTSGFVGWAGPKWRSGPIAHAGTYEATWIFYVRDPAGQLAVPAGEL